MAHQKTPLKMKSYSIKDGKNLNYVIDELEQGFGLLAESQFDKSVKLDISKVINFSSEEIEQRKAEIK